MPFVSPEDFAKQKVTAIQDYAILSWQAIVNLFSRPRYWSDIFTQMDLIGVGSLPTIALTDFSPAPCLLCSPLHRLRPSAPPA